MQLFLRQAPDELAYVQDALSSQSKKPGDGLRQRAERVGRCDLEHVTATPVPDGGALDDPHVREPPQLHAARSGGARRAVSVRTGGDGRRRWA